MVKMALNESLIRFLESFRDIDDDIEEVEGKISDLILSYDYGTYLDWRHLEDQQPKHEDEWYEDDLNDLKQLQQQLKDLKNKKQKEYEDTISKLPKETTRKEFDGFDISKTDPPYVGNLLNNEKEKQYYLDNKGYTDIYIAEMTPQEYLELCGEYAWKRRFKNIQQIYDNLPSSSKEVIHEYAQRMKNGEKAPTPYIDIKDMGQEGRHRAFAAIEAGIDIIPVVLMV